jgi:ATP-dependent DNA helicase RecG
LGTHALLEEEILFSKLGLVIVDEQHRFGVMQRVALRKKGLNPHCLVMTATPIPRTLAMTVYGDLDLSIIDELPPGRIPILTKIIPQSQSARLYKTIENEIRCGHQAYIVYPLIEESETLDLKNAMEMFEKLQTVFPHFRLALIHGRMKTQEKDEVMASFKSGKTQILVSTTVIEVGIDVANATLMVIENAERFGLSQLHQLRGRVGRGKAASQCILVPGTKKTQDAKMRLNIMVQTNDGFRIAEEDLRIRGPGEVLGTRQAGLPIFCYAELRRDAEIFDQASQSAKQIFLEDPKLENPENQLLQQVMLEKWQGRLQLSRIG